MADINQVFKRVLKDFEKRVRALIAANGGGLTDGDKGDVTVSGTGTVITIDNDVVTNAKAANMSANSIKGNNTGGSADPADLTGTQVTAMLDVFSSTLKGLTPASGGGTTNFLRADGNFAAPPAGAATLDELTDVVITSAADYHVIQHNGTTFVNRSFRPQAGTRSTRVAISSPGTGQQFWQTDELEGFYSYNGSEWKYLPNSEILIQDHFFGSINLGGGYGFNLVVDTAGTGAGVNADNAGDADHGHIVRITTGSTGSGRAGFTSGSNVTTFGNRKTYLETVFKLVALSDGTDVYTLRFGFQDSLNSDGTDGMYFRYTHGTNSGKWEAVTRQASTETATDTGITADTNWHRLAIKFVSSSLVEFYIDGVLVASNTTNIPNSSQPAGAFSFKIVKGSGTNAREIYLDSVFAIIL